MNRHRIVVIVIMWLLLWFLLLKLTPAKDDKSVIAYGGAALFCSRMSLRR